MGGRLLCPKNFSDSSDCIFSTQRNVTIKHFFAALPSVSALGSSAKCWILSYIVAEMFWHLDRWMTGRGFCCGLSFRGFSFHKCLDTHSFFWGNLFACLWPTPFKNQHRCCSTTTCNINTDLRISCSAMKTCNMETFCLFKLWCVSVLIKNLIYLTEFSISVRWHSDIWYKSCRNNVFFSCSRFLLGSHHWKPEQIRQLILPKHQVCFAGDDSCNTKKQELCICRTLNPPAFNHHRCRIPSTAAGT